MRDLEQAQQDKHFPTYNRSCSANALCCGRQQDDLPIQPPHGADLCRHRMEQKCNKDRPTSALGIRCKYIPKSRHDPGVPLPSQLSCLALRGRAAPPFILFFFFSFKGPQEVKRHLSSEVKASLQQKLDFIFS